MVHRHEHDPFAVNYFSQLYLVADMTVDSLNEFQALKEN